MKKERLFYNSLKISLFLVVVIIHIIIILTVSISSKKKEERKDNTVFKMVDIQEYIPPPPVVKEIPKPKPVIPKPKEEVVEVPQQEAIAEEVIETEKVVVEVEQIYTEPVEVIEYLPQHKISDPPKIPTDEILKRVIYPPLANKQKIEGIVYLELFIDQEGNIRNIEVLKDPGFGLTQAAIDAITGLKCTPAKSNGKSVPVRFRYPVRFKLK